MADPGKSSKKRLIVILENASLETVKAGKDYQLLNCDKHKNILLKNKRDISNCRPDIAHQCLMMLMDSPLNRAGLLQVYVHTSKNVLIEVHPETRIPRTFDRFCGLMVQLLQKFSIQAAEEKKSLLKVIKNPVSSHLPTGCTKIATSYKAEYVHPRDLVPDNDEPIVFVVGAMAVGSITADYTEKSVAISEYPLSAATTCDRLCAAFEEKWGIL